MLTALGIIFGVAAVIAMMAIGAGAQQEILDQMKLVGVNNIIITPKPEKAQGESSNDESSGDQDVGIRKEQRRFTPGLTLKDAESIQKIIPTVERVSPEIIYETDVMKDGRRISTKLTGVTPDFFTVFGLELQEGDMFNEEQMREGIPVCIIGPSIQSRFFTKENPIGKEIKCGHIWLRVIGVLKKQEINQSAIDDLGISDYNNTIYAPIQTILRRYKDRTLITSASVRGGGGGIFFRGDFAISFSGSQEGLEKNQIDKIVVQVKESSMIGPTTEILKRMITRRHVGVEDIEIKVPELLLRQEQRTKDIFNIVLGAIASISLLVGGIGIMNIMLASVMERIKEIGIRQAIGATKKDIIFQFLSEAVMLSITGGLIGIILGLAFSKIIMELTGILTIISPVSILISFGVSVTVGIVFGYMPAKRAAKQDPVVSLRHE
ncbi:MAG: ABC transporter permease [Bacteroidales bacterium]|nr:ABC transporter permease [Bacteroidales bacterium]